MVDNDTPGPGTVQGSEHQKVLAGLATNCTKTTNSTIH